MVPRPTRRRRAYMRPRDELAEPRVQGSGGISTASGIPPKEAYRLPPFVRGGVGSRNGYTIGNRSDNPCWPGRSKFVNS